MKCHTEEFSGNWIQTFCGRRIDFQNPQQDQISIVDIAHGLSNMTRFSGQCSEFYSVAQHSVLVSDQVPYQHRLQAILHDATEAYMSDVPSPIKHLCPEYKRWSDVLWEVIAGAFNVPVELHPSVKEADIRMLATERNFVFRDKMLWGRMDDVKPYDIEIECMNPSDAEDYFETAYYDILEDMVRA